MATVYRDLEEMLWAKSLQL